MSLADYQDAWNQLLFDEKIRKKWKKGNAHFSGLSDEETETINSFPEDRIELIAPSTVRGRSHVFYYSIPRYIARFIAEDTRQNLAYSYAVTYPEAGLHPRSTGLVAWLSYIRHTLIFKGESLPHLEDLLTYEIKSLQLIFYRIPVVKVTTTSPCLVSWAGLIIAGPDFPAVLELIKNGGNADKLTDNPKHGYILSRGPYGVSIEPLHWTVFEILSRCNGDISWPDIVKGLIEEETALHGQAEILNGWEKYFLKKGNIKKLP